MNGCDEIMIDVQDLEKLSIEELVHLYSAIIKTAKKRGIIRTKNFIGEIGEALVIEYYNKCPQLPNLAPAPVGTENIDAISRNGERYSIKTVSGNVTGVFYGLQPIGSKIPDVQKFEYVVICAFNDDYELKGIYELTWKDFLKHKKWHSRMTAWNLSLNKNVIEDAKIIFAGQESSD